MTRLASGGGRQNGRHRKLPPTLSARSSAANRLSADIYHYCHKRWAGTTPFEAVTSGAPSLVGGEAGLELLAGHASSQIAVGNCTSGRFAVHVVCRSRNWMS